MSYLASRPEQSTNTEATALANLVALGASPSGYAIYKPTSTTFAFFLPAGSVGSNVWGTLTGTLSNQLDLQAALNDKQNNLNGTGFVKSTAGVISYDSNTYLTTASAATLYQPLDADLTTIANLTATTNNILQSVGSAWASRTPTQVTATLDAMVGDSGAGGAKGLVPAQVAGDGTKFLRGDGTFQVLPGGGNALTTSPLSQFASTTSAQLRSVLSDENGTGVALFDNSTSATFITPNLGTPSTLIGTNITGTAAGLSIGGNAATATTATTATTVTTNANLTGPITSVGNTTSVAAQTGTGSVFAMQASPALTTPNIGVATATSVNGLIITASTGTITITNLKTLTVSDNTTLATNSITFAGGEVVTFTATNALTFTTTGGTNVTLPTTGTLVNTAVTTLSSLASIGTITTGTWTGTTIAFANGGTGLSTWTQYLIPYAATTTSIGQIAIGTSGQVLTSNGPGAVPTFQTFTPSTIGNKIATSVSDVTIGASTTETALLTVSIPANTLSTANAIKVKMYLNVPSTNNAGQGVHIRLKYGGTAIADANILTGNIYAANGYLEAYILGAGATNSQEGGISLLMTAASSFGVNSAIGTSAEDSTGALNLVITWQWQTATGLGGTSLTMSHYIVEKIS